MAALIGALRVSLSADTAKFEDGMKRAQRQAQTSASAISKSMGVLKAGVAGLVSGLSIGLLTNVIKNALDYAGSLGEVSQQLGVTTRDLQVFRYAAGQNGVSTEELDKGLGKLTITMGQVAAGAKAPTAALNAIGVSADDLKGKDTGEAFRIIADGLQNVTDRSQRAAVEVALFGRAGAKLDTLLSGGSERINELSAAAETLGIVLSDEQIAKADETADRLDALKTVLSAQISGIVADNADAIVGLANALADLVGSIAGALRSWRQFRAEMNAGLLEFQGFEKEAARARGSAFVSGQNPTVPGRSVTIGLGPAKPAKVKPATAGGISRFLAGGGGGGKSKKAPKAKADNTARDALSDAFRFDEDIRRAQMDVLRAMQNLSTDAVERYTISVQIKDAEKAAYDAELNYQTQLYKLSDGQQGLTEAQAAQLRLQYDKVDQLERDKLIQDENNRAAEASAHLDIVSLELQRDALSAEAQNAETAKEQRRLQLRILDLNYKIEKARLEAVIADQQSSEAAKEEARRRLAALPSIQKQDEQAVLQGTQGPMESYLDSLPGTTEKWNEALEEVQVRGLQGLEEGLMSIIDGTKSVGEAFHDMAMSIIQDLIRIAIQKLIVSAIGGFSGGGEVGAVGMATGGFVSGPGGPKADKIPAMLSNGEFVVQAKSVKKFLPILRAINEDKVPGFAAGGFAGAMPIPRAPSTPHFNVANDDVAGQPVVFDLRGAVMTQDLLRQMNEIGTQAADAGGNLGVKRMRDLNQRTFGRAAR